MPYIDPIRADEADDRLAERLRAYEDEHGRRPVLWEVLANHPPLLSAHATFYQGTVASGTLDRELKELVGVAVSRENRCDFCVASHRTSLVELFGYESERIAALTSETATEVDDLSNGERAAIEFARTVARNPNRVTAEHVAELSKAGFDDSEVVELVGVIAQFVAANVYAEALGIDPGAYDDYSE